MTTPENRIALPSDLDTQGSWFAHLGTAVRGLEKYVTSRFDNLGDLTTRLTSPVRGMLKWVNSPGYFMFYNGTRWLPFGPRTAHYRDQLTTATDRMPGTPKTGFDHRKFTVSRPHEPYLVTVAFHAIMEPADLTGGREVKWRFLARHDGREVFITADDSSQAKPNTHVTFEYPMPAGGDLAIVLNYLNDLEVDGAFATLYALGSYWSMTVGPLGETY